MGTVTQINDYLQKPCLEENILSANFAEIRQLFDECGVLGRDKDYSLADSTFLKQYVRPKEFDPNNKEKMIYTLRLSDGIYVLIDGQDVSSIDPAQDKV